MTKDEVYSRFYKYCKPIISREASFFIKSNEDREELEQNAFLRVCKKLHLYKKYPNVNFRSWVKRLTKNMCLRYLETKKSKLYLEDLVYKQPMVNSVEDEIIETEKHSELMSLFGDLDDKRYKIMSLKYISLLKNEEIANILDIPLGTVKSTIHRILKKLQNNPNLCQQYKNCLHG